MCGHILETIRDSAALPVAGQWEFKNPRLLFSWVPYELKRGQEPPAKRGFKDAPIFGMSRGISPDR